MRGGNPLNDDDRAPWLARIRHVAEQHAVIQQHDTSHPAQRPGLVVACSALKHAYRSVLRGERHARGSGPDEQDFGVPPPHVLPTYFVFMKGSRETLLARIAARQGHFMKSEMLDSQLATLESPEDEDGVVVVPVDVDTETQVRIAREELPGL